MPTMIWVASYVFATTFACVQHLDVESSRPPPDAQVYRYNINTTIMELYGGHIILKCRGGNYSAHTLEDR